MPHRPPTRPRTFVEKEQEKPRQHKPAPAANDALIADAATPVTETFVTRTEKRNGSRQKLPKANSIPEATPADIAEMDGLNGRNHLPASYLAQLASEREVFPDNDSSSPEHGRFI